MVVSTREGDPWIRVAGHQQTLCCRESNFNRYLSKKRCDSQLRASRGRASGLADTPPPYPRSLPISNCVQSGTRWNNIPRLAGCAYRGQTSSGVLARVLLGTRPESSGAMRMAHGPLGWRALLDASDMAPIRGAPCAGRALKPHRKNWRKSRLAKTNRTFGDVDRPPERTKKERKPLVSNTMESRHRARHVGLIGVTFDSRRRRVQYAWPRVRRGRSRSQER